MLILPSWLSLLQLAHALSVFAVHARGPLFEEYARQVETECEAHWKAGRQMCQVLSLTGNPCTKPLHRGGGDGAGGGELLEEEGYVTRLLFLLCSCFKGACLLFQFQISKVNNITHSCVLL